MSVEAILDWNMSDVEAEVYHIALAYEKEYRKTIGNADLRAMGRNALPRRGDPRKSNLFRHCWRLRRETRGILESKEYRNYIHANLLIIHSYNGYIEPNCVCGDKAWLRYKVWKRRYDIQLSELNATAPPPSVDTTNPKIILEIDRTKKFLFERCEGEVTFEKLKGFIESGIFKLWFATGKVSPYYVAMSPLVAKICDIETLFARHTCSLGVVQEKITKEVKDYFKHEYAHEFASA